MSLSKQSYFALFTLLATGLLGAPMADAQALPAQPSADQSASPQEPIVVTGSRVPANGFNAPSPVSVIGGAQIQNRATTNIADILNEQPAFRATTTPATRSGSTTGAGYNYADLRGLGSNRTLILLDGRRQVPTAITGQVDLNLFPTILVDRLEAVTGGTSAAYGSDAVAGVVNVILKKNLTGLRGEVQSGVTQYGDGNELRVALAGGTSFAQDRGHFIVGGEYLDSGSVSDRYSRPWGQRETALVTNPTPGLNGNPARIIADNVGLSLQSPGTLVTAGPLRGLTFTPGGGTRQYQFGTIFGSNMIGGEDYTGRVALLRAPVKRFSVLARAEYALSDAVTITGEAALAQTASVGRNAFSGDQGLIVQRDNPFLPAAVRAQMVSLSLQTLTVGRFNTDIGTLDIDVRNRTARALAGFKADLGNSWKLDGYVQYGENSYRNLARNNRINARYTAAIDAVSGPNGTIVCRSTLTNPNDGCVPFNIFGSGSASPAAFAYVTGMGVYHQTTSQWSGALNTSGSPFSTWAGKVSIAAGIEARRDRASATSDALSQANAFQNGNLKPIAGQISVVEGYGEIGVPLARDLFLAKSIDLNGAVRRTDYSTSGGVTTWKAGLTYEPFSSLRLRATRSRDIRAPNISELYTLSQLQRGTLIDRNTGLAVTNASTFNVGNPDLRPEKADTLTLGAILKPAFIRKFTLSVDYFDIKLRDQISTLGAQNIIDFCFRGANEYCSLITRTNGALTSVVNKQLNLFRYRTSGLDIEAVYQSGPLTLRGFATRVFNLTTTDTLGDTNRAGQLGADGGVPKWVASLTANLAVGPVTITGQGRFIGAGVYDVTLIGPGQPGYSSALSNSISNNHIPAAFYANLGAVWDVAGNRPFQFFATINNLFDKDPSTQTVTSAQAVNTAIYDTAGRTFKFGVRMNIL